MQFVLTGLLTIIASLAITVFASTVATAVDLSAQQEHGRQIYLTGTSPTGGAIEAVLGNGETKVKASLFPCAGCHGEDGRGRAEGGVVAAEITWHALTKPYQLTRSDRRPRPPYVRDSLVVRAFSMGLDAGGGTLSSVMPRYRMPVGDAKNLMAYLKVLGRAANVGVTAETVKIGLIVPPPNSPEPAGKPIGEILTRYFTSVNEQGGVYGRRLELSTFVLPAAIDETGPQLRAFLEQYQPLVFASPVLTGREQIIEPVLREQNVPATGPIALRGAVGAARGGPLFYMLPGLAAQARILASFQALNLSSQSEVPLIMHAAGRQWQELAEVITERLRRDGMKVPSPIMLSADADLETLTAQLSSIRPATLFLLAPDETGRGVLRALFEAGLSPKILSPGLLVDSVYSRMRLREGSRLFLSWPAVPADQSSMGLAILDSVIADGAKSRRYSNDQLGVVASAAVLVEGLRLSGRELSRRKLIESLEKLYRFPTGLIRPITFGPNRRLGSSGAYVIEFDIESGKSISRQWIDLD